MKKPMMVLPLVIMLAYCSGPNNTQTTTSTDTDATASASTSVTAGTDTGVTVAGTQTMTGTTSASTNSASATATISDDTTDYSLSMTDAERSHWDRVNGQHWTWDMDYPGYKRPVGYNEAINGNWQLVMTPELVTAWRADSSRSLWANSAAYISASESFNTTTNVNAGATGQTYNNGSTMPATSAQGNVQVNGSTAAGTVASGHNASHSMNNAASGNATVANQANGATTTTSPNTTVSANAGTTGSTTVTGTTNASGSTSVSGSAGTTGSVNATGSAGVNANAGTTGVTGTAGVTGTTGVDSATTVMDVNSINYNAANGNLYQLPKFNLYLENGSFTGYTGCNGVSGRVEVTGNSLRFLNTTPSTVIDCMGGFDESVLLDILKRVDSYTYTNDELQLMQGSQVLLRFKKNNHQEHSVK